MKDSEMLDKALAQIMEELDEIEGTSAMSHSAEECPDPLNCPQHSAEHGDSLSKEAEPAAVKIEVHKLAGMPSLDNPDDGKEEKGELKPEEAEALRKLLK